MITTVTPNPALDLSGIVDTLLPNEKNSVFSAQRDPGGNGINAARIISRLKGPVEALGFLGGAVGEEIRAQLRDEGVTCAFTPIRGQTRTNVTVTRLDTHQQTRLTFPGPRVTSAEQKNLLRKISSLKKPGLLVLGGSLPQGCPSNFHLRLVRALQSTQIGAVIDIPAKPLRAFTEKLRAKDRDRLLFVKPNQLELEEWSGRALPSDADLLMACRELQKYFPIVCLSLGARGAWLVTSSHRLEGTPPPIQAKGSVGAGDSFVGGFCDRLVRRGIHTRADVEEASPAILAECLRWGLAAGSATAQVIGTTLGRANEVRRLVTQIKIRESTLEPL